LIIIELSPSALPTDRISGISGCSCASRPIWKYFSLSSRLPKRAAKLVTACGFPQ
jgi:hypothetical protein